MSFSKKNVKNDKAKKDFLIIVLLTFGSEYFFAVGGCPIHYSSIPDLYLLDFTTIPLNCDNLKLFPDTPGEQNCPHLKSLGLK